MSAAQFPSVGGLRQEQLHGAKQLQLSKYVPETFNPFDMIVLLQGSEASSIRSASDGPITLAQHP
jgi:hypothetical protein